MEDSIWPEEVASKKVALGAREEISVELGFKEGHGNVGIFLWNERLNPLSPNER